MHFANSHLRIESAPFEFELDRDMIRPTWFAKVIAEEEIVQVGNRAHRLIDDPISYNKIDSCPVWANTVSILPFTT